MFNQENNCRGEPQSHDTHTQAGATTATITTGPKAKVVHPLVTKLAAVH